MHPLKIGALSYRVAECEGQIRAMAGVCKQLGDQNSVLMIQTAVLERLLRLKCEITDELVLKTLGEVNQSIAEELRKQQLIVPGRGNGHGQ